MNPVSFPESNRDLGAPAGMEGACGSLPVFCDGESCISCWQPTQAEREAIAAGAPIWLQVFSGHTQPPVALAVQTNLEQQAHAE